MNLNHFGKILSSVLEISYIVRIQKISQVNNGTIILKKYNRHQLLVQKVKKKLLENIRQDNGDELLNQAITELEIRESVFALY